MLEPVVATFPIAKASQPEDWTVSPGTAERFQPGPVRRFGLRAMNSQWFHNFRQYHSSVSARATEGDLAANANYGRINAS